MCIHILSIYTTVYICLNEIQNVFKYILKACLESREHRTMEKYDKDPSVSDASIHTSYCIKTEAGSFSNIVDESGHELHHIKTESDIDTYMTYFNNPTSDTKSGIATIGLDTKSSVSCIKLEPQYNAAMQSYPQNPSESSQNEAAKPESVHTVVDRVGGMYMVNDDNQSPLHMCDSDIAQSEVKVDIPYTLVCLKHEHTCCDDDSSVSPVNAANTDVCRGTDGKPYKCIHCIKSFTRLDSLTKHSRVHSGENHTCVISV
jgi:hypothetical protein